MSKSEQFLKEEAVAMPSGTAAANREFKHPKRPKWINKVSKGIVIAGASLITLSGCVKTNEEVEALKNKVPEDKKNKIELSVEKELADNMDRTRKANAGMDSSHVIMSAVEMLEAKNGNIFNFPKSGEDYVARDYADKLISESRTVKDSTWNVGQLCPYAPPQPSHLYTYKYKPEFERQLKERIKTKEKAANFKAMNVANKRQGR